MTDADYARKLDELDRLLNDPDVPMLPDRIWSLLADVAAHDAGIGRAALAEAPARVHAAIAGN